jgi:hypothetical protein
LDNFTDDTVKFWQSFMRREVSREDARQIAENVSGFFRVLVDWDATEQRQPTQASGLPSGVAAVHPGPVQITSKELPKACASSKLVRNRRASALEDEGEVAGEATETHP